MIDGSSDIMQHPQRNRWILLALLAAFCVLYLPALSDLAKYHGDEHFYTDAAARMLETGTYGTPTYADRTPRLNKPLLTYWVVAASFRLLGVNAVASRLPFLLAACLLVWLTWHTGLRLLADPAAALLGAVILLTNQQIATLACRATPDMLLCLFMAVSLHGFARLILLGQRTAAAYACAWAGAGLAVAAKGAPGLVAVVFSTLFLILWRATPLRLRDLFHPPSVLLGIALAAFGFATPYLQHGTRAVAVLYEDQIGVRPLAASLGEIIANLASYLRGTVIFLLPWVALLALVALRDRAALREAVARRPALYAFGLGWWVLLLSIFALHDFVRLRYLAPAYPLLSILAGSALTEALRDSRSASLIDGCVRAAFALLAVCGSVLLLAGGRIDVRLAIAGALCMGAAAAVLRARRWAGVAPMVALGGSVMLCIAAADTFVRPVFDVSPAPAIAQRLLALGAAGERAATVGLGPNLASKIRLASGGRLDVDMLPNGSDTTILAERPVLVVPAALADRWSARGYRLEACGYEYGTWTAADIWALVTARDRDRIFEHRKRYTFLAFPNRRYGLTRHSRTKRI